jgi:pyruvate formate lyase activating enzyme
MIELGGIQKNSMIDYPGKISCVIFLSGCNFDCPYCHNPDLARGCQACPDQLDKDELFRFLEARRSFLDGVVISGGEPTLQPDLESLCRTIKAMGYPIKLDTNGSRPRVIAHLIDTHLVDYIAMDLKTDPACYAPLIVRRADPEAMIASARLIIDSGVEHEFRTTCIKPLVNTETIEAITRLIEGASLFALQQCREKHVLHPEFFQAQNRRLTDADLQHFQQIAATRVRSCVVR